MKISRKILYYSILAIGIPITSCNTNENFQESSRISMGIDRINITPEVPIRMSGYAGRTDPFSGVHDSLYLTASVFSDSETTAVLITADIIGFSMDFYNETVELIEKETGINAKNILISATHNHGGPTTRVYRDDTSNEEIKYIEDLQLKIVSTVKNAFHDLQPVRIGAGTGSSNLNINRRARYADGTIYLGLNPDGPCDHDVAVVRIDDNNNNPLAVFANWPCHGTVSGQQNTKITGDWPGALAKFVNKTMESDLVVSVTAGASGDINPIYGPSDRLDYIDAIGMLVGEEVIDVAKKIQTTSHGNVDVITKKVIAKGKKTINRRVRSNRIFPQEFEPDEDVEINLSVLRVGDILFAGISGELMTEIGMDIKNSSPIKNTIVVTHCNGSSGYLCTDEAYLVGGYEVLVTKTMPGTESLIKENILEMIHSIEVKK